MFSDTSHSPSTSTAPQPAFSSTTTPPSRMLFAHCGERLAKFKLPKSIDYTAEMPRDPNGKLYKRKLRDPYWEGRTRAI